MQIWFLIAAIGINLFLALLVFTRVRTATATAYFGISGVFIVLWALGTLAMLFGLTFEIVQLGFMLFLIAPMATALYMVLFARHFVDSKFPSGPVAAILFSGATLAVAIYTLLSISGTEAVVSMTPMGQNAIDLHQPWFTLYGSYFILIFSIAYGYLASGLRRRKGRAKTQLIYVFLGAFLTSFLALITNIILPYFGQTDLLWLGPTWTVFYVVTTAVSMMRHRLFDVRLALVLAFTYSLSLTALAVIYYTIAFALSAIFVQNQTLSAGKSVVDVGLALVLAFLFQPIKNFFDRLTNRIFFRRSYYVDDFVARLGGKLNKATDLRKLLERAAIEIATTLQAQYGLLVVRDDKRFISEGSKSHVHLPADDVVKLDAHVSQYGDEPIITELLDKDHSLRRLLVSHHVAIALPLNQGNITIGYLLLGAHNASNYVGRDIKTLMTIRDELVIAIQNSLSIHTVKELNETLQQRVNEATKELRASNAQLQRLDRAKDEFVSMASHQLRTPLTSVKGYISMVIEGDVGKISDSQKHLLGEAFTSSERMVHLINDFLNVSRLQTGKFLIEKRPINLAKVVKEELDSLSTTASSRNLTYSYTQPKKFPTLDLDEGKIRQVVMNFADNSLYYSTEFTTIVVKLAIEGKDAVFTVKDVGIGVPKSEQSQLFSKFYRASNARKQRPDGTGVGLFLAKKVIDAHGGEVIFESVEGQGSTFGFRLPVDKLRSAGDADKLDN